jgi:hypothetical protein
MPNLASSFNAIVHNRSSAVRDTICKLPKIRRSGKVENHALRELAEWVEQITEIVRLHI